jgi:hypothetical protein
MDQIRKLVSGRLRVQAAGSHPDADLLSAFAEKALPDAERTELLQHLGGCAECREIVYLAADSPHEQRVLAFPRKISRGWALRWGSLAASIVVIGALVGTRYQYQAHKSAAHPPAYYDKVAEEKVPAELDRLRDARVGDKKQAASAPETPTKSRALPEAKHMTAKPQTKLEFDKSDQVRVMSAPAPVNEVQANGIGLEKDRSDMPATAPSVIAGQMNARAESPKAANESVEVSGAGMAIPEAKQKAAPSELKQKASQDELNKAPEPAASSRQATTEFSYTANSAALAIPPQWTVSRKGALQRSIDAGRTWQAVAVAPDAVFRVLWVSGANVWAGGKAGILYHSTDSGQTWTRIEPVSGGQKLEADVKHIDFSDTLNGAVNASNGEVWSTSDGGLTWQRK